MKKWLLAFALLMALSTPIYAETEKDLTGVPAAECQKPSAIHQQIKNLGRLVYIIDDHNQIVSFIQKTGGGSRPETIAELQQITTFIQIYKKNIDGDAVIMLYDQNNCLETVGNFQYKTIEMILGKDFEQNPA